MNKALRVLAVTIVALVMFVIVTALLQIGGYTSKALPGGLGVLAGWLVWRATAKNKTGGS